MVTDINKRAGQREPTWVPVFLKALSNTSNVRAACERAQISYVEAYRRRARNPRFAERWEEALELATQLLEAEMWRRAMSTSDTLLIFALKARRPEVYRERLEHTGAGGGPIRLAAVTDDELERRIAAQLDRQASPGGTNGVHPQLIEGN